jgi:hypothetical protein
MIRTTAEFITAKGMLLAWFAVSGVSRLDFSPMRVLSDKCSVNVALIERPKRAFVNVTKPEKPPRLHTQEDGGRPGLAKGSDDLLFDRAGMLHAT